VIYGWQVDMSHHHSHQTYSKQHKVKNVRGLRLWKLVTMVNKTQNAPNNDTTTSHLAADTELRNKVFSGTLL